MLKVVLMMGYVSLQPLPNGKPDVRFQEQEIASLEDCLGVVADFLSHTPKEMGVKAVFAGCRVEDKTVPAKLP